MKNMDWRFPGRKDCEQLQSQRCPELVEPIFLNAIVQ
jgi:hypothetical protein